MNQKRFWSLLICMALIICIIPVNVSAANDFPTVLAEAKKGVVPIYGLSDNGYLLTSWTGTGFAVGEPGKDSNIFLTNQHVVVPEDNSPSNDVRIWILQENCEIDERTLEPDPNKSITCEVLKTTSGNPDYAIIRATEPVKGYKPLPLLSSETVPDGLTVYALGYPGVVDSASASHYGIDDITSTNGMISQHMQYAHEGNTWVLMHTAQISGGNSGGPLITEEGAVVGLNTYGFGENQANMNRYCAVYIDYAIEGLDDLGLPYELFDAQATGAVPEDTQESEDSETETTSPDSDKKDGEGGGDETSYLIPLLAAGGVAAAVVVLVIVLKRRKEKELARQRQEEYLRRQEAERRRQEEERRRQEAERRRQKEAVTVRLQLNGGTIYPIPHSGCIIGRDYDCTIRLPEKAPGVSHHHCKLEFRQDQLILKDMHSSYGTYIHGKRIPADTPVALRVGSSFCLGSEQYKFTVC